MLLHVRQNFFFFYDSCNFLLLFALDALDAFSLNFNSGRLLLRRLLQCAFLARAEAAGPLVRRRLAHEVGPATFHECNFVLPPLLKKVVSTVRELGALHASPEGFFLSRLQFFDGNAAVQACF